MDSTDSWLSPARLTRFGLVVLVGLVSAVAIVTLTADGTTTIAAGRLGGDWAPFRTAGVLALQDPSLLLDTQAQATEMAPYLDGKFAPFPYPPLFAYVYVPLAALSFEAGYVVYVALLATAAAVGITWTMDLLRVEPAWRPVGLLGGLTYAGTFASWGGAQNATLTLVILAGALRLLDHERPTAAGLALTLLWFKPQFAVPVLLLLLVARHFRPVLVALSGGIAVWIAHVFVFGRGWMLGWLELLRVTDSGNRLFNTDNTLSLVEWLRGTLGSPWGDVVGLGVATLLALGFAWVAARRRQPTELLVASCLALLVTAPHALRYELALLVPALGVLTSSLGIRFGLLAWAIAPLLILDIPPLLRVAYVWAVAMLWLRDTLQGDAVDAPGNPVAPSSRTTRGHTLARDVEQIAQGVPS